MELIVEFLESAVLRREQANFIVISLSVSSVGVLEQYSVPKSNSHHEYSEDLEEIIRMLSNYFWRYSNEISFIHLIRILYLSNIHYLFLIEMKYVELIVYILQFSLNSKNNLTTMQ